MTLVRQQADAFRRKNAPQPERDMIGDTETNYTAAILARQPIFDKAKQVRGYELLFRHSSKADNAQMTDEHVATMKVVADAYVCLGTSLVKDPIIMVNFSMESVLMQVPYALPPGHTVVELAKFDAPTPEMLAALDKLKRDGYLLCLDDFAALDDHAPLLARADFVKLDVLETRREELARAVEKVAASGARLLAKRVETAKLFDMAVSLGFSWFQGFFFQKPEIMPGRKLPSNQLTRLKIFRLLEQDDVDIDKLAEVIQADVSISYRLLTLLNSAAFGLPAKIRSIQHAIIMLGMKQLRNWLRVIIFTDMAPKGKSRELSTSSVIRGRFLENTAEAHGKPSEMSSSLFLMGLFSLLEALLDIPMRQIAENLPLDDHIKEALCGGEGEYADWLNLARCFENANWASLDRIIADQNLDPAIIAKSYFQALDWANTFFIHNV